MSENSSTVQVSNLDVKQKSISTGTDSNWNAHNIFLLHSHGSENQSELERGNKSSKE